MRCAEELYGHDAEVMRLYVGCCILRDELDILVRHARKFSKRGVQAFAERKQMLGDALYDTLFDRAHYKGVRPSGTGDLCDDVLSIEALMLRLAQAHMASSEHVHMLSDHIQTARASAPRAHPLRLAQPRQILKPSCEAVRGCTAAAAEHSGPAG